MSTRKQQKHTARVRPFELEAALRERNRRKRRRTSFAAAVTALLLLGGVPAAVRGGASRRGQAPADRQRELASLASLGKLNPAGAPGAVGPEGVPVGRGSQLASGGSAPARSTIDGIIHIESPVQRTYTLGNFFDVWGQKLAPNQVGPVSGPVTSLYNGRVFRGNPRRIPLTKHAQIQLEVGRPLVAPILISFPAGL